MIRKVYEANPLIYPRCGRMMEVVVFIMEHGVVDRISFGRSHFPPPTVLLTHTGGRRYHLGRVILIEQDVGYAKEYYQYIKQH